MKKPIILIVILITTFNSFGQTQTKQIKIPPEVITYIQNCKIAQKWLVMPPGEIKIGNVGVFIGKIKIIQVVNDHEMVVGLPFGWWSTNDRTNAGRVWVPSEHRKTAYISGISTKGITDETYIKSNLAYHIKGTKTYTTIMGASKTIFLVVPINSYFQKGKTNDSSK